MYPTNDDLEDDLDPFNPGHFCGVHVCFWGCLRIVSVRWQNKGSVCFCPNPPEGLQQAACQNPTQQRCGVFSSTTERQNTFFAKMTMMCTCQCEGTDVFFGEWMFISDVVI